MASDTETQLLHLCTDGNLPALKDLITKQALNPNEVKDPSGLTLLHLACQHGHLDIVQYLINDRKCNPETTTTNGCTPLHTACKSGRLHIIKCLITDHKCNPHCTDNDGYTPLHAASESGNIEPVEYLITEQGCDPHGSDSIGNTPLHYASQHGQLDTVKCLITEFNCDLQKSNSRGSIPLHFACLGGQITVARYIIDKHHLDPNTTDMFGNTPLHYACLNGYLDITRYLISDCNCNPQCSAKNGNTPLHCACQNGHLEVTKYLITEHKCSPEHGNVNGYTPLHSAASNGHLAVVKYLISELVCNPQVATKNGFTPLHYACLNGYLDIAKYLTYDCKCNTQCSDKNGNTSLHYACQNGHLEVAKYLITEHKCNQEHGNVNGYTPLHAAASNGCLAVVKYLISELCCNPQIVDISGITPLHYACLNGHLDVTKYLISDYNCNPECSDKNGNTSLHYACQNGHLEVAKYLITGHKCNQEHGNVNGYTPLHSAASNGCLAVVKYLISELGCNPQVTTKNGFTPLHYACLNGHLDITKYLTSDWKCNPQCSDKNGNTPLHCACENGHLEVAKYLIAEHKCSPEHGNVSCITPLHSAANNGHLAVVKHFIIELGCNPQIADNNGLNPLHFACLNGYLDVTKCLISDCNCNPQCSDKNGNTPLHYACQNGHLEVTKYLITENKCNPEHGNDNGDTPLHSAAQNGHLTVVKYLIAIHNCNPQWCDIDGVTPLHVACSNGHLHVAKYLIHEQKCLCEPKAKLNPVVIAKNLNLPQFILSNLKAYEPYLIFLDGYTPLHSACVGGHLDTVKYLIDVCKCNPNNATSSGLTAIDFAKRGGQQEIVEYLRNEHQCSLHLDKLLSSALFQMSCDVLGVNCTKFYNMDIKEMAYLPLHQACFVGNLAAVKLYSTKLNYTPSASFLGNSPLHTACMMGRLEVANYLISELGCDPQITGNDNYTPLHYACVYGHLDITKYLISDCNCNPQCLTNNGLTPLHFACLYGHIHLTKYLISDCNCNPQSFEENAYTPLHSACENGHLEVAKYLITAQKCNPEHGNVNGYIPLHSAASNGHLAVVKYLIAQCNCNPQCCDINGVTPLHEACASGHLHVVKYLIQEENCSCNPGAIINDTMLSKIARKGLPLHNLIMIKAYETFLFVAHLHGWRGNWERGVAADKAIEGITPLHSACMGGQLDIVKYLTDVCNCDPNHSTSNGFTAIDFAQMCGHNEVIAYLKNEYHCSSDWAQVLKSFVLQAKHESLELKQSDMHISPLQQACITGSVAKVNFCITKLNCNPSSAGLLGLTPLHTACMFGHLEIAKYLVTECKCDPNCCLVGTTPFYENIIITPLYLATAWGQLGIVRWLVSELQCYPECRNNTISLCLLACMFGKLNIIEYLLSEWRPLDLSSLLFAACCFGHTEIAKYLIDEYHCNPRFRSENGATSLHFACTGMHHVLMKEDQIQMSPMVTTSNVGRQDRFPHIWHAIMFPFTLLLNLLNFVPGFPKPVKKINNCDILSNSVWANCERPSIEKSTNLNLDVVKYLITEHKCNPQCTDEEGQTPLHYACASGQLEIVQYFHSEKLHNLVHTAHSGDSPLHFACKYNQVEVVQFLLATGECDPLIKNTKGLSPVEIAPSPEVRKLLGHFCKGKYPLESVVKVFVFGDPMAGKSSLVQAIKCNPGFLNSVFGRLQKVKRVRPQTAGIDSFGFSSSDFGYVFIYDFAGQREFHTCHAAFLQYYSTQMAGIFIVVINFAQSEDDICQSLQYWLSFIQDCCTHNNIKPHVMCVASHADQIDKRNFKRPLTIFEKAFSKYSECFYKDEEIAYLDCRRPSSSGLDVLRSKLKNSCNSIRKRTEKIDQRCYALHKHIHKACITKGIHGSELKKVSNDLEGNPYLLPSTSTELIPLFQTLHDKGQVLFLKNNQDISDSWVITNIAVMLETVVGSIFAPRDFPQHIAPGSTGIVPKSRISEAFPDLNIGMIIGFLEHFEFCHRVGSDWVDDRQSNHTMSDDEYYLFPALLTSGNVPQVLLENCEKYYCGWLMYSTIEGQFFTTRFLHVLLLRLAFLFAQPHDDATQSGSKIKAPALSRRCNMWESGISWPDTNGVKAVFEMKGLKTATLTMTCMERREIHCVRLRTKLMRAILKAKNEFCPHVHVEECIVEVTAGNLKTVAAGSLYAVLQLPSHSITYLSRTIANRDPKDDPDLILTHSNGSTGKQISEVLYFEPYAVLTPDLITQLFAKENAREKVSSSFITELASRMYSFSDALEKALKPDPSVLSGKCKDVHLDSLGEISRQQLKCKYILEAWLEQQQPPATYKRLQQELNEYSIFCGRNPLNLVRKSHYFTLVWSVSSQRLCAVYKM